MNRIIAVALCAALLAPAPAFASDTYGIMGKDGNKIGDLSLTASPHGTLIDLKLQPGALSAGRHGLHFHETADCSDSGQYKKSGEHAGHGEGRHGLLNPDGPEPGDLPNLVASADGSAEVQLFTQLTKLDALKDADGSAFIIHAQGDDHVSQPIGKSGDRVACAGIK